MSLIVMNREAEERTLRGGAVPLEAAPGGPDEANTTGAHSSPPAPHR
jgi:hypothetical protein